MAFGLKFNAKGTIDCYENDLERLPLGKRRVIKFKMIEGDFELFEGEWSIEQVIILCIDQRFPIRSNDVHETLIRNYISRSSTFLLILLFIINTSNHEFHNFIFKKARSLSATHSSKGYC